MTREEAITYLKVIWNRYKAEYEIERETLDAYHMAIEALQDKPTKAVPPSLAEVYKWERDIALSQLEEYGIGFAEKKRDDLVEVVRCKDCKHYIVEGITTQYGWCHEYKHSVNEDDYCSYGERKK